MLFKLSNLNSNLTLTLGYLNPEQPGPGRKTTGRKTPRYKTPGSKTPGYLNVIRPLDVKPLNVRTLDLRPLVVVLFNKHPFIICKIVMVTTESISARHYHIIRKAHLRKTKIIIIIIICNLYSFLFMYHI